ncbi:hypothetical protein AKJ50_01905 [candidate division MSBL1 archaeon SCGC-AAA382A13]|uniref:Uncharacterized protein n=1 Tax=candidate division MSBL1 archaeon SCGC-AAA382A13 TaxID=1698279 RepID=A0A133VEP1_9EURY|nr:hypothetical protein AKJ50_01905 [candidate division MSBL1 archaeon SCGC-AAA382A13]
MSRENLLTQLETQRRENPIEVETVAMKKLFDKFVWILVYDFVNTRENSSEVRKFYRNLKKLDGGERWTNSELVFREAENAVLVRDLADSCGAKTRLYVGMEVSSRF